MKRKPTGGTVALGHASDDDALAVADQPAIVDFRQVDWIAGSYPRERLMGWIACRLPARPGQIDHVRVRDLIAQAATSLCGFVCSDGSLQQGRRGVQQDGMPILH